jgi:hypothetical protein
MRSASQRKNLNWMENRTRIIVIGLVVVAVTIAAAAQGHGGTDTNSVAQSTAVPGLEVSSCEVGGKTQLAGIPLDATQFRFVFMGGGLTGHTWHTDWLPNDKQVKDGAYWIYTLGDSGTTASGVTGEVEMSDGSTASTDLQICY